MEWDTTGDYDLFDGLAGLAALADEVESASGMAP